MSKLHNETKPENTKMETDDNKELLEEIDRYSNHGNPFNGFDVDEFGDQVKWALSLPPDFQHGALLAIARMLNTNLELATYDLVGGVLDYILNQRRRKCLEEDPWNSEPMENLKDLLYSVDFRS